MKHFALGLLILLTHATIAQHCPYDFSTVLLIELDFESDSSHSNFQMELVTAPHDSSVVGCKDFALLMDLEKRYVDSTLDTTFANHLYQRFSEKYGLKPNHYAFFLNNSQFACYKDDKIFLRNFRLRVSSKNSKSKTYEFFIDLEQIYNLCIGAGSWKRVQAMHLKVKKNGEFIWVKN